MMAEIPETIYHYCSPTALEGILSGRKIYFTHISYFEDQSEFTYFEKVAIDRLQKKDPERKLPFHEQVLKYLKNPKFLAICCASFATEWDSKSHWMEYADRGKGFAIGFSRRHFEAIAVARRFERIRLERVVYDRDEHEKKADEIIEMTTAALADGRHENESWHAASIIATETNLAFYATAFKSEAFSNENEIRLIRSDKTGMKFRVSNDRLIPFYPLEFNPTDSEFPPITEIVLGPRVQFEKKMRQRNWAVDGNCWVCQRTYG